TAVVGELVRRPVDLIAAYGTPPAETAKAATTTIPIVMIGVGDPVRVGLVTSLARPGGNITGNTVLSPDLGAKRLQLLREAIPSVARVAYLTPLIPIAAIPPPAARRLGLLRNFAVSSASTACRLVGSLVGTAGELADCPAISMEDGGDRSATWPFLSRRSVFGQSTHATYSQHFSQAPAFWLSSAMEAHSASPHCRPSALVGQNELIA